MIYKIIAPPAHLKQYVRFYWTLESELKGVSSYTYRSLADSCPELIFHFKGAFHEMPVSRPTTNGINITGHSICQIKNKSYTDEIKSEYATPVYSMLHAQSREVKRFTTYDDFGIFGAYLYPFAIPLLFSVPAYSLSNQLPDLFSLLGNQGKEVEEKMLSASDNESRAAILSEFLSAILNRKKLNKDQGILSCIRYHIATEGQLSVNALAERSFLSVRQFERKFKEYSGFTPKTYTRIIRFQKALTGFGEKDLSLTEIAYRCGYYDQSHFIHDFKEFSGYDPSEYFFGNPEGSEYRTA